RPRAGAQAPSRREVLRRLHPPPALSERREPRAPVQGTALRRARGEPDRELSGRPHRGDDAEPARDDSEPAEADAGGLSAARLGCAAHAALAGGARRAIVPHVQGPARSAGEASRDAARDRRLPRAGGRAEAGGERGVRGARHPPDAGIRGDPRRGAGTGEEARERPHVLAGGVRSRQGRDRARAGRAVRALWLERRRRRMTTDEKAKAELRAAFDEMMAALARARDAIDDPALHGPPATARNLAEGYRYLMSQVYNAIERGFFEDPRFPYVRRAVQAIAKSTIDNADAIYFAMPIDGNQR